MIHESIVTTRRKDATTHIAPMGIQVLEEHFVIAPFKPSSTLDNLRREGCAVINYTDDVRIFAGCVTGRRSWPLCKADRIEVMRLKDCLTHAEVIVEHMEENELRPRFYCRVIHESLHAPFHGYNRAQAAVLEAAILVSRLDLLPAQKIDREINYLKIAVEKTAGPREREAWSWVLAAIESFKKNQPHSST